MKNLFTLLLILLLSTAEFYAQVYTNKVVGNKNEALIDSLKETEYPYALPILGAKAAKRGYDLPYSAGLGVNYLWQKSDLSIEGLSVGFNNGPLYDLSEIIRFNSAVAKASAVNFRPDIWILPFLNIYGLFAVAKTSTEINAGVWLPDQDGQWSEMTNFSSKAEFDAKSYGFGLTPTMGIGGGWMALDMNCTWTDVSALDKPVFTYIFGPRFGKTFRFKSNPKSNVALWVGGFRLHLESETNGSIALNEVISLDGLQEKVDAGMVRVGETSAAVEEWWAGLTSVEQKNPVNAAKYETANRALDAAGNLLTGLDGALNDENEATVQYHLNKKPKDMWNFIIGSQYQINKHFMIRAEFGFLASRTQFIGGLQYRFGL